MKRYGIIAVSVPCPACGIQLVTGQGAVFLEDNRAVCLPCFSQIREGLCQTTGAATEPPGVSYLSPPR